MLRLLYALLLAAVALCAHAGGFGAEWMSHPAADDSSCVWFGRAFVAPGRPRKAVVAVSTTGRFVLYVNGRNVSTARYMPHRPVGDTVAVSIEFDVTRFLRRDTNTVAVLYCPSVATRRQVAVSWWGVDAAGGRFADMGAVGWLCRRDGMSVSARGESIDGAVPGVSCVHGSMQVALWRPVAIGGRVGNGVACGVPRDLGRSAENIFGHATHSCNVLADNAVRVQAVLAPRCSDVGAASVTYDFSPGFCGSLRLTLRGCRRGQRIRVGDASYTCSGEMDEQMYCRFATPYMRRVTVTGDSRFRPDQIQSAEAVNVVWPHGSE